MTDFEEHERLYLPCTVEGGSYLYPHTVRFVSDVEPHEDGRVRIFVVSIQDGAKPFVYPLEGFFKSRADCVHECRRINSKRRGK